MFFFARVAQARHSAPRFIKACVASQRRCAGAHSGGAAVLSYMTLFNTQWRNDSAAGSVSPGAAWQMAGLSPALGTLVSTPVFRVHRLTSGAARRFHNCGASECQAAVVPPSPVVQSPRALNLRGMHNLLHRGCARLRTKRPTGPRFSVTEFQRAFIRATICVPLNLARAQALRMGFFIRDFCGGLHRKNFCRFESHNATQQI